VTTLKLAVVGVGHLGKIHLRLARDLEGVELIGAVDPSDSAREASAEANVPWYAELADLPERPDAVVLAAPTGLHHSLGLELLGQGVHLLVEKPICSTSREANDLIDAARENRCILQVGHVERFNPGLSAAMPYLHDVKYIEAKRTGPFPFRSMDVGVVLDLMIHDLDIALCLVRSTVQRVEAFGVSVMGGPEDAARARVVFDSGCVADFTASRISYEAARTTQVWSARGFAAIDFGAGTATLVEPSTSIAQREFNAADATPEQAARLKERLFQDLLIKRKLEPRKANAIADEQRDFVHAIRNNRGPRVSGEQGRNAVALAEKILHEIARHEWDGHTAGRIGPHATPVSSILSGPHWDSTMEPAHRRAG